jgi:hypothetical protein
MTIVRSAEFYDASQHQLTAEQWQNARHCPDIQLIPSASGIIKGRITMTVYCSKENYKAILNAKNESYNNNSNPKLIPLSNDAYQRIKDWPGLRVMFEPELIVILPTNLANDFFASVEPENRFNIKVRQIIDSNEPSTAFITASEFNRIRHHEFEVIQSETGYQSDGQFLFKIRIPFKDQESKIMFDILGLSTATLIRRCPRSVDFRYILAGMNCEQYKSIQHLPYIGLYDQGRWVVEIQSNTLIEFMKQLRQ